MSTGLVVRDMGLCEYRATWQRMRAFTRERGPETADEIWLGEHYPVYTQGTSCHDRPRGLTDDIPLVHSDRGGQITYHGPGQLIAYLLLDIRRRGSGPKRLVGEVEQVVIDLLGEYDVVADRRPGAPGVYAGDAKIAALGLRISNGCCYHGLSLNVSLDLGPFDHIDPCGYQGLAVTRLCDLVPGVEPGSVRERLKERLRAGFA